MSTPAGKRNRLIRIYKRMGKDALNQPTDALTFVIELWAQPKGQTGMSVVRSVEEGLSPAPTRYSWRVKFRPNGLEKGMVLDYQGHKFNIIGLAHDFERRDFTDIICDTGARPNG